VRLNLSKEKLEKVRDAIHEAQVARQVQAARCLHFAKREEDEAKAAKLYRKAKAHSEKAKEYEAIFVMLARESYSDNRIRR